MSTKAKLTLFASIVTSVGIISYVHIVHKLERDDVKTGVKMDIERQARKKQNLEMLEQQQKLAETMTNVEKQ